MKKLDLPIHTASSAPREARAVLEAIKRTHGRLPNALGVLAGAPAALQAHQALAAAFDATSFDPVERQVILLTASAENGCRYCVAVHSTLAPDDGLDAEMVAALRSGAMLTDPRLDALREFTVQVVRKQGFAEQDEIQRFLAAGFQPHQVLELLTGVALKVLTNYANGLAQTPLDEAFTAQAWEPPAPLTAKSVAE